MKARPDNPTAAYRSTGWGPLSALAYGATSDPLFTWAEVPLMELDAAVDFGLRTLRSPYQQIDIATDANSGQPKITGRPEVQQYILATWRRFWRHSWPLLLERYYKWGRAPGGVEWRWDEEAGRLELDQVRAIEPYDCVPHVHNPGPRYGQFAGYELRSPTVNEMVKPPYAFWFAGFGKLGQFCDAPRLRAAFAPWLQKTAPMGLANARRLYNWTQAVGITVVRHPGGKVDLPDGTSVPAAVQAQRIGMALQNGSIVEMSSRMIPSPAGANSGEYEWDIDQREPRSGGKDINDTVKDVDGEIWFGMGIPTEVIRAMESGSGFAGRSIPMETWFGQHDELAQMGDQTFRRQVLHRGITANFGKTPWDYEISSLLEDFRNQGKQGPPQQGGPAAQQQPGGGGGGGGGSDYKPDGQSRNGNPRFTNPAGQHRYGSVNLSGLDVPPAVSAAGAAAAPVDKRTALLRRAAALAMIQHRLDEIKYSRRADPETRDALAELADDPEEVAAALGSVSLSWINYGRSRSGKQRWKNDETGQVRYQERPPGEHSEDRQRKQGNARRGHEIIDRHVRHEASADDLRELSDHLSSMTVRDLRTARAKLQAGFKGAKQRDGMVRALLDHVEGRRADRAAAEKDTKPTKATRDDGTPVAPRVEDVHTVPTSSLKRKPELMQYKVSGIGKDGVTDELKGVREYKPELGGTLLGWRDPETGEDIVVNGHHRHELADRAGAETVNVRYLPVKTAAEARAVGAIANIAEGRGTATDAAKLMRDSGLTTEDLQKSGVSLSGRVAADAAHLKDLGDGAFQRLTEGRLDEAQAVAVAKHLKDPKLQDALFKKLEQREEAGKDWSTREIEAAAKKMAAAGRTAVSGSDLFGDWEDEASTFDQEVELEAHVGRALGQAVNDFAAVSNVGRASRVSGAGNVLVTDENQRRREEAARHAETFNVLVNRSGPIADAIKASAAELAKAKSKRERDGIKSAAVERVRAAIGHELGDKPPPSQPAAEGQRDSGGAAGAKPAGQPAAAGRPEKVTPDPEAGGRKAAAPRVKTKFGKTYTLPPVRRERSLPGAPPAPPVMLSGTAHAPPGGTTVAGQQFAGGQFIPADVMAKATPEERAKLVGEASDAGGARAVDHRPEHMEAGFAEAAGAFATSLSDAERAALKSYTVGNDFREVNGPLRAGKPPDKLTGRAGEMNAQWQAMYDKSPVYKPPVTVYRGIKMDKADVPRLLALAEEAQKSGGKKLLRVAGWQSTSLRPEIAHGFSGPSSPIFEIAAHKGPYLGDTPHGPGISHFSDPARAEAEMLLPPNQTYRVVGIEHRDIPMRGGGTEKRQVIRLEQVIDGHMTDHGAGTPLRPGFLGIGKNSTIAGVQTPEG